MNLNKRTRETPWRAVDVMTGLHLGWYETETAALIDNETHENGVITMYMPPRGRK